MYCLQSVLLLVLFLLFLQDDRVYSPKRQQNYDINEEKRNEAKRSKQNKKEKKTPNRSSPFIYCTCHCHHGTSPMNQMWFFFDFFCTKCEEAVSYICNEECAHYYHISPNKVVHWVFVYFHHFLIGNSLMLLLVLFQPLHAISKYNAIVCSALDAKIM